jgi:hypothetical protein
MLSPSFSRFQHPHIIRLLGYTAAQVSGNKNTCLIYEMGSRGSVASILRNDAKASIFLWRDRVHVAHGVVSALNYLHCHQPNNPVFHCDVKSDNIVVTADYTAKVIDCGLAKYKPDSSGGTVISTTGVAVGTPGYMCRTYIDTHVFDSKSEIYSVGIVLLEIMTGQVQQRGMSLYNIYIEDEEELVADVRAGTWHQDCLKAMAELARECLEKYKKRIGAMLTVLRRLKHVLNTHCQLSESDRARAKELVMMQQEKDEARVKGVLAEHLQRQLQEHAEQLMALREVERHAQVRREQEQKDKEQRMRTCAVCWDECDKEDGIVCKAGHFMCAECLNAEVKEQTSMENIGTFKKAKMCLKCRVCSEGSWLDISCLTKHLKEEGFLAYLRVREAVLVADALQEQEQRAMQQVEELQQQIHTLAASRDAAVLRHKKKVIEDILTLKCPRQQCRRAFIDFEGCFALTCDSCRCAFCAYCLHDCGDDAHMHVGSCQYNLAPGKSVFASIAVFERAQRERRTRLLRQYFAKYVEADMRAPLVGAMARDFADLGIEALQLR